MTSHRMGVFVALVVLLSFCGCGEDRKKRAQKAYLKAEEHKDAGRLERARIFYEEALGFNPYHEQANFQLAVLFETRSLQTSRALFYYKRFLDLSDDQTLLRDRTRVLVEDLTQMQKGLMEDPCFATDDLARGARVDSMMIFSERLHGLLIEDLTRRQQTLSSYFQRWKGRMKNRTAKIVYRSILKKRGRHDAEVWVDIEEGKTFIERRRLRWRLEDNPCWELVGDETMKMTG